MKGQKVLIANMWYLILDTIIALHPAIQERIPVTVYLAMNEKDEIKLILPQDIEVWEKPLPVQGLGKGSHVIS